MFMSVGSALIDQAFIVSSSVHHQIEGEGAGTVSNGRGGGGKYYPSEIEGNSQWIWADREAQNVNRVN